MHTSAGIKNLFTEKDFIIRIVEKDEVIYERSINIDNINVKDEYSIFLENHVLHVRPSVYLDDQEGEYTLENYENGVMFWFELDIK